MEKNVTLRQAKYGELLAKQKTVNVLKRSPARSKSQGCVLSGNSPASSFFWRFLRDRKPVRLDISGEKTLVEAHTLLTQELEDVSDFIEKLIPN